jgi:acetylornithine deacetylase
MNTPTYTPYKMLQKLVSFDTTSRNSNLQLIEFVSDYLSKHAVKSHVFHDPTKKKANLVATIGPELDGGIMLSSHTDVVPVDGQNWDTDPFAITKSNRRIYGRGTADMKSFPAIFLALLPKFLSAPLKLPVHLALSYDEEVGCLGAPHLIKALKALRLKPKLVIIGEPTEMKVINRHKSVFRYRTTVSGIESHSAHPDKGVNAIFFASDVIHFLHQLAQKLSSSVTSGATFDPPYSTLHIGTITGGTASNIVPKSCSFDWEVRLLPGSDIRTLVLEPLEMFIATRIDPLMRTFSIYPEVSTENLVEVPGLKPQSNKQLEDLLGELTGSNSEPGSISFGTEGGLFQRENFSTLVCGPGNILQAHKPNEYIELSQLNACEQFMERLLVHLT